MTHTEFATRPEHDAARTRSRRLSWDSELYHGTEVASVAAAPENGLRRRSASTRRRRCACGTRSPVAAARRTSDVSAASRAAAAIGPDGDQPQPRAAELSRRRGARRSCGAVRRRRAGRRGRRERVRARATRSSTRPAYRTCSPSPSTGKTDAPLELLEPRARRRPGRAGRGDPRRAPDRPERLTTVDGTSFSAPIVAAAAAWVWTRAARTSTPASGQLLRGVGAATSTRPASTTAPATGS